MIKTLVFNSTLTIEKSMDKETKQPPEKCEDKNEGVFQYPTNITLNEEDWDRFIEVIENSSKPSDKLKKLLATIPPWE